MGGTLESNMDMIPKCPHCGTTTGFHDISCATVKHPNHFPDKVDWAKVLAKKGGFITKDSGERQQFSSGMQRDTSSGKFRFDLVRFGPMFRRWVGAVTRGAVKYGPNNWMKAEGREEQERFLESAARHFEIWFTYRQFGINVEDPDNPTREPLTEDHAAAVFFNINGTEYVAEKLDANPKK